MSTYNKGRYQAEIKAQGFEASSTKGTPCFALQLLILNLYDAAGEPQECPRFERTYRQYLANDIGVNILKGHLKTFGVEVTSLTQLDPDAPGYINLVGRTIDVICELETYQGKQQERWTIPNLRKKLNADAVRALNDKFGHVFRDGNSAAKPSPAVITRNDSDVPF